MRYDVAIARGAGESGKGCSARLHARRQVVEHVLVESALGPGDSGHESKLLHVPRAHGDGVVRMNAFGEPEYRIHQQRL